MFINTYSLNQEVLNEGRKAYAFCKKLHSPTKQIKLQTVVQSLYIIGTTKTSTIPIDVEEEIENNGIVAERKTIFQKLMQNEIVYSSELHTRSKKTNSTCATYYANDRSHIGIIRFFIRLTDCECRDICQCAARHYAVIKQ